jgi:hypothetical protein
LDAAGVQTNPTDLSLDAENPAVRSVMNIERNMTRDEGDMEGLSPISANEKRRITEKVGRKNNAI